VQSLVGKHGLGTDPEVQVLEDALELELGLAERSLLEAPLGE